MQRLIFIFIFLVLSYVGRSQSIAGTNIRHWYDPASEVQFRWKVVSAADSIYTYFQLSLSGQLNTSDYQLIWETRESYGQRVGDALPQEPILTETTPKTLDGKFIFKKTEKPWLLTVRVQRKESSTGLLFFHQIEPNYPVNGFLQNDQILYDNTVSMGQSIEIVHPGAPASTTTVFRYRSPFPTASPPFVEKDHPVDPILLPDSTFRLSAKQAFRVSSPGLYLFQVDTNSSNGFCYYVGDPGYPKYSQLKDLAPPIVYVSTKEEFDKIILAGNDKAKFDQVILDITEDKERAKNFIRSYFRRVEVANRYFSSYKAGWKTDRGMIFTIFGPPDEVNRTSNNEVWNYKSHQVRFTFVRSPSLFDPHNYVLVRDKRFGEKWYSTIDLWRKSRF